MRGPAQLATYLGVTFAVIGFVLIGLAWNFAAEHDTAQQQFPHLLSGGVGGLGLIITGMGLLVVQAQRELSAQRAQRMRRLQTAMDRLGAVIADPAAARTQRELLPVGAAGVRAPEDEDTRVIRTTSRAPAPAGQAEAATVVLGRSSFHDPSCHLVVSRDDLERVPRQDAVDADLSPCRICKP